MCVFFLTFSSLPWPFIVFVHLVFWFSITHHTQASLHPFILIPIITPTDDICEASLVMVGWNHLPPFSLLSDDDDAHDDIKNQFNSIVCSSVTNAAIKIIQKYNWLKFWVVYFVHIINLLCSDSRKQLKDNRQCVT